MFHKYTVFLSLFLNCGTNRMKWGSFTKSPKETCLLWAFWICFECFSSQCNTHKAYAYARDCVQFWCFISTNHCYVASTHTHTHSKFKIKKKHKTKTTLNAQQPQSTNSAQIFTQGTFKMCICTNKTANLSNFIMKDLFPFFVKQNELEPFPANFGLTNVSVIKRSFIRFI